MLVSRNGTVRRNAALPQDGDPDLLISVPLDFPTAYMFAGVKPYCGLLVTGSWSNLISPGCATVRSHHRLPPISKKAGDGPQLKRCAVSWRINIRKSSPRKRPNALLDACTCAKDLCCVQPPSSKTITRASADGGDLNVRWLPMRGGFRRCQALAAQQQSFRRRRKWSSDAIRWVASRSILCR